MREMLIFVIKEKIEVEPIIFYSGIFLFKKINYFVSFLLQILYRVNCLLMVIGLIERYYVLIKVDRKSSKIYIHIDSSPPLVGFSVLSLSDIHNFINNFLMNGTV